MITGDLGADAERFHALGAWNVVTQELMVREELKQRGISYTLPQIFPTLGVPPLAARPPPQGPPLSPLLPQELPRPPTPHLPHLHR